MLGIFAEMPLNAYLFRLELACGARDTAPAGRRSPSAMKSKISAKKKSKMYPTFRNAIRLKIVRNVCPNIFFQFWQQKYGRKKIHDKKKIWD